MIMLGFMTFRPLESDIATFTYGDFTIIYIFIRGEFDFRNKRSYGHTFSGPFAITSPSSPESSSSRSAARFLPSIPEIDTRKKKACGQPIVVRVPSHQKMRPQNMRPRGMKLRTCV